MERTSTRTAAFWLSMLPLAAQEPAGSRPAAPEVPWRHDLQATLAECKAAGKPVLVFFTAGWCQPCKQLEREVCATEEFARLFAGHGMVKVDIDAEEGKAAKQAWEVQPIPDLRFVSARGVELGGFVGYRTLAQVTEALAQARRSEAREGELRDAIGSPPQPEQLLALAEHLLTRPTKAPALVLLERVAAFRAHHPRLAARADWQIVGARFHPIGRPAPAVLADAQARLKTLTETDHPPPADAPPYGDAIRAWIEWQAAMRAWSQDRERSGQREQPLEVAMDAPLRKTLAALLARCDGETPPDAAGDGLLIDGLLHYYSGDHKGGAERLDRFTRVFPRHRWHDEGVRFAGICRRLMAQRPASSSRPGR